MNKSCCRCGSVYEDSLEFFRKTKAGNVSRICRPCDRAENKRQKQNESQEASKARGKRYRERHAEELKESKKKYRDENKEKEALRAKLYRQNHKEQRKVAKKRYYTKHPDKKLEKSKLSKHKREAKQKLLPFSFSSKEWDACKCSFNNKCCYCGKDEELQQDHFIPLAKNGEYTKNNIVPACPSCNISKSDKDFFEWYPQQTFYSKKRERAILKYLNYQGEFQQIAI